MSRYLVAGGAGFIGSHLVDYLIARGDSAVIVDNLSTGQKSNISHLLDNPSVLFVEHDITADLPDSVVFKSYDAVLDLASPASPSDFATMPLEIMMVGSIGTKNLLDLATQRDARFFLASTSEVYGDPLVHPQPETYLGNVSSIGPRSCYDEAKRFSEALAMTYHRKYGTDVRIVRIFNTYGERMRLNDGRVVCTFIKQALAGEPITLYGTGEQTRSFCYVSDEVRGLVAVLDGDLIGPVNVGNPDEYTMRELAEKIVSITGSSSEIITVPLPPEREGDPMQRRPDITLINSKYGWKPSTSLDDGLLRMATHYGVFL